MKLGDVFLSLFKYYEQTKVKKNPVAKDNTIFLSNYFLLSGTKAFSQINRQIEVKVFSNLTDTNTNGLVDNGDVVNFTLTVENKGNISKQPYFKLNISWFGQLYSQSEWWHYLF